MIDRYAEGEPAAELLQRRWFAAMNAAESARDRCELLLEAIQFAEKAWFTARARCEELDALRDALADDLAALEEPEADSAPAIQRVSGSGHTG